MVSPPLAAETFLPLAGTHNTKGFSAKNKTIRRSPPRERERESEGARLSCRHVFPSHWLRQWRLGSTVPLIYSFLFISLRPGLGGAERTRTRGEKSWELLMSDFKNPVFSAVRSSRNSNTWSPYLAVGSHSAVNAHSRFSGQMESRKPGKTWQTHTLTRRTY